MAEYAQSCAEGLSRLQPWEEAKPNQTSVPFEKQYFIRDTEATILKQNVGMFKLRNGVEVHFQSFGSFNMSLWDDMMEKFKPLSKKDILFLGEPSCSTSGQDHTNAPACPIGWGWPFLQLHSSASSAVELALDASLGSCSFGANGTRLERD